MVYLLDPDHDARLLKSDGAPVATRLSMPPGAAKDLTETLRLLQLGQHSQAMVSARRETVKTHFPQINQFMKFDEFTEICSSRQPLTPDQLRRVLLAQLSLIRVPGISDDLPQRDAGRSDLTWSQIMATARPDPVPSLSLETITEFDPAQCEFRNGKWIKP
jgi:hypothetical protein